MSGGRRLLIPALGVVTIVAGYLVFRHTGARALDAATSPDWTFLAIGFTICLAVQPLRAWAWASTVREPIGFQAVYAASSVGSFLDTVLPCRLGEGSKIAVLKVASGVRWPGISRAGGSLLCAHLLEMIAFALVGAVSAFFLPLPTWARWTCVVGLSLLALGIALLAVLHRKLSHRLPRAFASFLAGAAAPRRVLLGAGAILLTTWIARWFGVLFVVHAVGIHLSLSAALLYMVVTGLANTAPLLPGNVGLYQGAAVGALAMAGHSGSTAVAASVLTPFVFTLATATAALVGLCSYGRRFKIISRAALAGAHTL